MVVAGKGKKMIHICPQKFGPVHIKFSALCRPNLLCTVWTPVLDLLVFHLVLKVLDGCRGQLSEGLWEELLCAPLAL